MKPMAVEELARSADVIVHGTVLSTTCQRDGEGRIFTRVKLQLHEVWKGNVSSNKFVIVHGGGTLGEERAEASAQVEYEVGEEFVAMLRLNERGEGVTLGLVQGKFHVWKDKQTGEKFAHNIFHGAPEATGTAAAKSAGPSGGIPPVAPRLGLNELKQRAQEVQR